MAYKSKSELALRAILAGDASNAEKLQATAQLQRLQDTKDRRARDRRRDAGKPVMGRPTPPAAELMEREYLSSPTVFAHWIIFRHLCGPGSQWNDAEYQDLRTFAPRVSVQRITRVIPECFPSVISACVDEGLIPAGTDERAALQSLTRDTIKRIKRDLFEIEAA